MLNNPVFFYIASVGIILFALLSLFAKNVIHVTLKKIKIIEVRDVDRKARYRAR